MSGPQDVVWIDEEDVKIETERAVLIENARGEEVWLPKSQLGFYADGRVSVPRWLADEKEIEG